ncbi:MAG: hypothetical protein ACYDDU_15645 [Dermatophilaceae bacterium]
MTSAMQDDLIDANPCRIRGASAATRRRTVTPATLGELAVICEAMPEQLRALVLISAWTALRFGQATELRPPVSAAVALSCYGESWPAWQSPNLLWSADRAWFLASEIDFDSTLVAGDTDLIAEILACPALDSWPVRPHDSLGSDGDMVNPTNQRALQHTGPRDGLFRRLATHLSGR